MLPVMVAFSVIVRVEADSEVNMRVVVSRGRVVVFVVSIILVDVSRC